MKVGLLFPLLFIPFTFHAQQLPEFTGANKAAVVCEGMAFNSNKEAYATISHICEAMDMKANFIVAECDHVENCKALLTPNGSFIFYNKQYLQKIQGLNFTEASFKASKKEDWDILCVLAHEIGHHVLQHLTNFDQLVKQTGMINMELEADQFAGSCLYKLGATLIQAQHVLYGPSVNEHATLSHPARKDRLAAIARGYNEAMQKQSGQKITHPTHPDIQQAITQFKKKNYDTSLPVLLDHASNAMVWPYLGQAYLWGRGLITDQEKGIYYYNLAAEQEDTTALYVLGLLEYLGHEVPKNKNKSLHHFKQAAGKGMAMAQCATALLLVGDSAAETHPENIQEAIQWWRKAANQKNPSGLFYLGVSYLWDLDNHPDPSKAKTLFEQALKANSPEALCFYGLLNEEGSIPEICPKINLPEAKKYYKLAAEWYQVKPAIEACKRLGIPVVNRSKRDFAEPNGIELFETVFWEMIK